jgi:hypothetical protein
LAAKIGEIRVIRVPFFCLLAYAVALQVAPHLLPDWSLAGTMPFLKSVQSA